MGLERFPHVRLCETEREGANVFEHIYFRAFYFPHCEQALVCTYTVPVFPTCTAFPSLSSAAGSVYVFVLAAFQFLFSP